MSAMRYGRVAAYALVCAAVVLPCSQLVAQLPAEIRGRITDAATDRPIVNARIEIVGSVERVASQPDGSFVVRGLEPRIYTVRVRAFGYVVQTTDIDVENGRAATLNVALMPVVSAQAIAGVQVVQNRQTVAAAGTIVLDRPAIEQSGHRDLGEILRTVPGVVVTQDGGPGTDSRISIRGSSANEVLVLVDGVPINSTITGQADLSQVRSENVERVTVIPGAQSSRYGSRALAGVVSIDTRRDDQDISALMRTGAWGEREASVTTGGAHQWGERNILGSLTADYRTGDGDFGYDVPAVRGGGTSQRINADVTSSSVFGSSSLDGTDGAIGVRAGWQSVSRGLPGSIVQPSVAGREHESRATATLDGRWMGGPVAWNVSANVTREYARFADPTPPYGTAYNDDVDVTGALVSVGGTTSGGVGTLLFGAESRTLDVTSSMLDTVSPHTQRQFGTWGGLRSVQRQLGGFVVAADLTARLDWDTFVSGAIASPRAGVTVSRGRVSAATSIGQGYAPPSLGDQFFHEGVLVRPNPDLHPERVRHDIDTRISVHDILIGPMTLGGEFGAYSANVDGMILWMPNFQFIWSPVNYDVHRSGWDVAGRAALANTGLSVTAALNQSDVTYAGPVLRGQVTYRPRTTANITGQFTHGAMHVDLANRYVGERRTVPGSALNLLAPYWLTDARISRAMLLRAWHLDASTGIENLFDRSTAMLVDYPFPGRTWTLSLRVRRGSDRHSGVASTLTP